MKKKDKIIVYTIIGIFVLGVFYSNLFFLMHPVATITPSDNVKPYDTIEIGFGFEVTCLDSEIKGIKYEVNDLLRFNWDSGYFEKPYDMYCDSIKIYKVFYTVTDIPDGTYQFKGWVIDTDDVKISNLDGGTFEVNGDGTLPTTTTIPFEFPLEELDMNKVFLGIVGIIIIFVFIKFIGGRKKL